MEIIDNFVTQFISVVLFIAAVAYLFWSLWQEIKHLKGW